MKVTRLFVYGTLKVGGRLSHEFDNLRYSCKKATSIGEMKDIGVGFPVARFNRNGKIIGEIHEYPNNVIFMMDRIEGYHKHRKYNLYDRITIEIEGEKCWAYQISNDCKGGKIIKEWDN